jgi:hypothetical protein
LEPVKGEGDDDAAEGGMTGGLARATKCQIAKTTNCQIARDGRLADGHQAA